MDSWVRKIRWRRDRLHTPVFLGFPGSSDGKEPTCNTGVLGLIPGLGRSPRGGHGNPLQYSILENTMDRGSWQANSQWGHKESHTTEQLTLSFHIYACTCVCVFTHACVLSRFHHVRLFASLWIVACQTSLSTGFSRQEY